MTFKILLVALVAALAVSVMTPIFKKQGDAPGRPVGLQIAGMWLMALAAGGALIFLGLPGAGSGNFLLVAAISGLAFTVSNYSYQVRVIHSGPVSISWSVVWMAAVVVAACGWGIFGEPVLAWQPLGIVAFLGCLAVMAWAAYRTNLKRGAVKEVKKGYWPWLALALATGATDGLLIKVASGLLPGSREGSMAEHLAFVALRSAVCGVLMMTFCKVGKRKPVYDRKTWGLAGLFAGSFILCLVLLLQGLASCPASEFFPTYGGAAIVFGTLWALLRGERPSRLAYLGVALAILAILLINLGGPPLWPGGGE